MIVAVARAEFHLPEARSLKDKRRFLKGLVDRLNKNLRVSTAETDFQDLHQRTEVGIAFVHNSRHEAQKKLDKIHRLLDFPDVYLISWDSGLLEELP